MSRVVKVMQMQLINKWTFLGVPAVILVVTFLLSYAIWVIVPGDGQVYSGATQAVLWYFLVLGIQSMTMTFPFSQSMGVSRRTFYLGTVGLFAVVALAVSTIYYLLGLVERATDGWGQNAQMFALDWLAASPGVVQVLFYFVAMVALFMIGFWFATVWKRWQTRGMLVAWIGLGAVTVGLVALTTWQDRWPQVGTWFSVQTPLTVSAWSTMFCAVLAAGSYLTLRRATP